MQIGKRSLHGTENRHSRDHHFPEEYSFCANGLLSALPSMKCVFVFWFLEAATQDRMTFWSPRYSGSPIGSSARLVPFWLLKRGGFSVGSTRCRRPFLPSLCPCLLCSLGLDESALSFLSCSCCESISDAKPRTVGCFPSVLLLHFPQSRQAAENCTAALSSRMHLLHNSSVKRLLLQLEKTHGRSDGFGNIFYNVLPSSNEFTEHV